MYSDDEFAPDEFHEWIISVQNQAWQVEPIDEDPNADSAFLALLSAINNATLPNNGTFMPANLVFPNDVLVRIVDFAAKSCATSSLPESLALRGALRESSVNLCSLVDECPLFWARAIFTPRQTVAFQVDVLQRVDLRDLDFTIRAASMAGLDSLDVEESLERFMVRTSALLHTYFPACVRISVEAMNAVFLDTMLQFIVSVSHRSLRAFEVNFSFGRYSMFDPPVVNDFEFLTGRSFPFTPFTDIILSASSIDRPTATYTSTYIPSDGDSSHSVSVAIDHPRSTLMPWRDIMQVISSSTWLTILRLDGVRCNAVPPGILASSPLPSLRELDVRFDGQPSLAAFLRILNVPGLLIFKFRAASARDIACLLECGAILANVAEFHVITRPDFCASMVPVFGWLHRITVLDLRLASVNVFGTFCSASYHTEPFSNEAWTCCARLEHLLVRGVRLSQLRWIVEKRCYHGCVSLKKINFEASEGYNRWDPYYPELPRPIPFFRSLGIDISLSII
ncbi:hypothetical protein C8R43DRAFT_955510 [Mycena crocata]|nr:hypothetical protein C8R43DRAFT_955510 [Mycena crocata]